MAWFSTNPNPAEDIKICRYFPTGSSDVTVHEGEVLTLTVHRDGSGADVTSVNYRTSVTSNTSENMLASLGEDFSDSAGELTFRKGVLDLLISVPVVDDEIPEDDEVFYVEVRSFCELFFFMPTCRVPCLLGKLDRSF